MRETIMRFVHFVLFLILFVLPAGNSIRIGGGSSCGKVRKAESICHNLRGCQVRGYCKRGQKVGHYNFVAFGGYSEGCRVYSRDRRITCTAGGVKRPYTLRLTYKCEC